MKRFLLFLLLFISTQTFSQRYLTNVFTNLDSTIAGVYGTSIDYQSNTQNLLYDYYAPFGDTAQKRPLIIYIHGGGFNTGSRTLFSVQELCRRMAKKGYAVANIDYRLDPNFDIYNSNSDRRAMTDAMHDAKQAIRYFKTNAATFKLDTNKFFMGGESAGGATTMMATYLDKQSEMVPYPMANPNNPNGSLANPTVGNGIKAAMCLCGLLLDTNSMETANDPPLLWIHSTGDTYVPIALSFNIVLRASNIGLPLQTKVFEGPHCPWYYGLPNWQAYLDSTVDEITTFLYPQVCPVLGINKLEFSNVDISLFPNPVKDHLTIQLNSSIKITNSNYNLRLIDITGREILATEIDEIDLLNSFQLNVQDYERGLYKIVLSSQGELLYQSRIVLN